MRHPSRFRLNSRGLLLAAISTAFAPSAYANSGRVDFTAGSVTVTGADGAARPLAKGNEVKTGDRIVSDANGRAQIRFSDGSYVSLQPNTDFDIKQYTFNGESDGTEKAFFGMLKGAMRTVTGLVGRKNRNAYQLSTPTATIGIRGTGGVISVGSDGSTLVQGTSGVWTLTTGGGSIEVPAGKAGAANTPNQAPQQTSQGPNVPAPAGGGTREQPKFTSGENRNSTGSQTIVSAFKGLATDSGYNVASTAGSTPALAAPSSAVFDSVGQMTSFVDGSTTYATTAAHVDFATVDGTLAWGRWATPVNVNGSPQSYPSGLHYVVGLPTPEASLPAGVTYTYNLLGATRPTITDGSVAAGTLSSATLIGNFSTNLVTAAFAGNIGGKAFSASASGMGLSPGTASFSGSGYYSGTLASSFGCTGNTSVNGFFSGSGATHAGFTYVLQGTTLGGESVIGAAALKR